MASSGGFLALSLMMMGLRPGFLVRKKTSPIKEVTSSFSKSNAFQEKALKAFQENPRGSPLELAEASPPKEGELRETIRFPVPAEGEE